MTAEPESRAPIPQLYSSVAPSIERQQHLRRSTELLTGHVVSRPTAGGLVVALGLCLTLLGGAPSAGRSQDGARADRRAIQALLRSRARAFRERDEAAFMATVSRAHPDFYRRQRRLFRWAGAVPFSSYRLVARWDRYGDLARSSDLGAYPGAERVAIPLTEERYRIGDYDEREAVEDLFYTFVRKDGRWSIAEDADLEEVGLPTARHLWDFGPVSATRSAHFLLMRHPCPTIVGCPAADTQDVLGVAEQALERIDRYWEMKWHKRVVILVPATTRELARTLQTTFDLDNFVAFAASTVDTEGGFSYVGHRVLFNPSSIAHRSSSDVLTILSHELVHVASRSISGPFVPVFVDEGIAEYVGHDADPAALGFFDALVAGGSFDGRLPEDVDFLTGSGTDIYTSYQEAQSAIRFFAQRWGFRRVEEFYRRLGRPAIAPGTAEYHIDRALRRTIGIGLVAFERSWADSIE